jgi:hypothetical protein
VEQVVQLPYLVAEKTDGVRLCVVLTAAADGRPLSFAVRRGGTMYALPMTGKRKYFKHGSVFDCELVPTAAPGAGSGAGAHTLLAFDACVLAGDDGVGAASYTARLRAIGAAVEDGVACARPGIRFLAKAAVRLRDARSLPPPTHASDGYILTRDDRPAPSPGMSPETLKIKEAHTLDLLWQDGRLWFVDSTVLYPVEELSEGRLSQVPRPVFAASEFGGVPSGTVVEVRPEVRDGSARLRLTKVRKDRSTPNNIVAVTRTLISAADNVTLDVVLAAAAAES